MCSDSIILPTAMKTPNTQCPGPSVPQIETEENPENKEGDLDTAEPATEGNS